jgi:phage shock protein A
MKLLERVSMLVRANLNDLVDRAEDPEKMVKQVLLDLHNQYIQVKTQLAVALTEQHMIEDKSTEAHGKAAEWLRKAELAVDRGEDGLAKRALERHNTFSQTAELFAEQVEEHRKDVELLRATLVKLEDKLREAEGKKTLLLTKHRAARARARAGQAAFEATGAAPVSTLGRMEDRIREEGARGGALFELADDDLDATFAQMERAEHLERQLSDLKARRAAAKPPA